MKGVKEHVAKPLEDSLFAFAAYDGAAAEKAGYAAYTVNERNAGHKSLQYGQKVELELLAVKKAAQHTAAQTAVKHQSAEGKREPLHKVFTY